MSNTTVQARVSPELKAEAEAILNDMGLSTADAIRMFLQHTVNARALPFQPSAKKENGTIYRSPGSAKHLSIVMADDFDAPLEDFADYMPDVPA